MQGGASAVWDRPRPFSPRSSTGDTVRTALSIDERCMESGFHRGTVYSVVWSKGTAAWGL